MTEQASTPLDGVDLVLADLDGVVYRGSDAIPHAVASINRAQHGRHIGYVTNNASRTAASVAQQLRDLGLAVEADDIVTSSQAAVKLMADLVPSGSLLLVVGGEGLRSEVARAGFAATDSAEDGPVAVIQGFAAELGWKQLAEAAFALQRPAGAGELPWVATNMDWTLPTARGLAPGNGTLVSAVHLAVGRLPTVAGKPETAIFQAALERFGHTRALFIGDRLDTDIVGANRAGIESALVLTGVDGPKQVLAARETSRPTYLLGDLRQLHEPYPSVTETVDPSSGVREVTCGDAVVELAGTAVRVRARGSRSIDLLRAASHALWSSGVPIYRHDVAPELYECAVAWTERLGEHPRGAQMR
jgi:HAD superfamily hydrolase (TIGR01450 family)